jgi:hypothetical protein
MVNDIIVDNEDNITQAILKKDPLMVPLKFPNIKAEECLESLVDASGLALRDGIRLFLWAYFPALAQPESMHFGVASRLCREVGERHWSFSDLCQILDYIRDVERLMRYSVESKGMYHDWIASHPGVIALVFLCNNTFRSVQLLGLFNKFFKKPLCTGGYFECRTWEINFRGDANTQDKVLDVYKESGCKFGPVSQFTSELFKDFPPLGQSQLADSPVA